MAEIKVPDIGDFSDVEIIEVLVAAGQDIELEQGLITLETDKASMDVPATVAGKLVELKVKEGDKVNEGDVIAIIEASETSSSESTPEPKAKQEEDKPTEAKEETPTTTPIPANSTSSELIVTVPDIGDFNDVEIIEVMVAVGDEIDLEQGLITLETDKASMDVPATAKGKLTEIFVKTGDKVNQGDKIAKIVGTASDSASAPAPAKEEISESKSPVPAPQTASKPAPKQVTTSAPVNTNASKVHASPAVRKIAREFGVDLTQVAATGNNGRILKEDIQEYVKGVLSGTAVGGGGLGLDLGYELPEFTEPDYASFGPITYEKISRIKQISGPFLHRNWLTIPHVTQFADADVTELEAFRKEHTPQAKEKGFSLSPLAFMLKAVCVALKHYPIFNSSLSTDGKELILKDYYHIGIAVDTAGGLVVPKLRDVDKKSIMELAEDMSVISNKAREGKLGPKDLQGGSFTISSLGGIGGSYFTPIINAPEVAILGVGRSEMKPKWDGKDFKPRLVMPLAVSYDHRVIDGANGARFITHLTELLGDIRNIVL